MTTLKIYRDVARGEARRGHAWVSTTEGGLADLKVEDEVACAKRVDARTDGTAGGAEAEACL
jgi:hypothetical protein